MEQPCRRVPMAGRDRVRRAGATPSRPPRPPTARAAGGTPPARGAEERVAAQDDVVELERRQACEQVVGHGEAVGRELFGDERHHRRRHRDRVVQRERAEHPHRPPLHRPAQPRRVPALGRRGLPSTRVEAEELLQLARTGLGGEPAVTGNGLVIGQEINWREPERRAARTLPPRGPAADHPGRRLPHLARSLQPDPRPVPTGRPRRMARGPLRHPPSPSCAGAWATAPCPDSPCRPT